ncbi:hypothetical protein [Agromyces marinus]|uniref:Lipoprotein n=1 Tax=Agromyces marinus TaxID=1389020 RepID=A0ABM8H5H0_9MICO|nr:hypothetical protein [Agromyces marinus]UIP58974.1 hypothetical protein DSM26151_18650 [Agromyces marinus]BDZ56056.1 hypothetical protein GCM10025870_31290 [Agromyces marinus]
MNTATALIRITAAASAVAFGVALAGCQGTRSDDSSESAQTSASSVLRDDLSPLHSGLTAETFQLPESTVDDDLSPAAPKSGTSPSPTPSPAEVPAIDDDLSPLGGR